MSIGSNCLLSLLPAEKALISFRFPTKLVYKQNFIVKVKDSRTRAIVAGYQRAREIESMKNS